MHLILNDLPCEGYEGILASSSRTAIELLETGHVTHIIFGPAWRVEKSGCKVAAYIRAAVSTQHIPKLDWSVLIDDSASCTGITNAMKEVDEICRVRGELGVQMRFDLLACMEAGLSPEFTFDAFNVDDGNALAYTYAFLGALNYRGQNNPLFIHGPSGSGKTHLLHATGLCRLQFDAQIKLRYLNAGQILAIVEEAGDDPSLALMEGVRNIGALLVDDLHLVDGNQSAQECLMQIIWQLIYAGKQIVLTSRKPLNELVGLDETLLAILERGMTVSLQLNHSLSSLAETDSTNDQ